MIFAAFIALIPAVFIAFLALSKKTSSAVRKASIIALILICLTFITCTTFLVIRYGPFTGRGAVDTNLPVIPQESKSNILEVIIPSAVVLLLMVLVIVLAFREQRKK
jgi:hypothetical protein